MNARMPALFVGHGNPMNALANNGFTAAWRRTGQYLPRPKAIVSISAHWYLPGTAVTAVEEPRTIHDFGGFPRELYQVRYPAPGQPELAGRVRDLLSPLTVALDEQWGLDHGTWSVLVHLFPDADVPVIQLSMDETKPASFHYDVGRRLAPLRDEGVLLFGTGNVVHNLHAYSWGHHDPEPFDWGVRFEERVRELLATREHEPLIGYEGLGRDAMLSAPTPEHYLPFLYIAATQREGEAVTFPCEGFDGGSVSMLAVQVG